MACFHETELSNCRQGAGPPEGLRGDNRCQRRRPPGHGGLQADGPVRAAGFRDLDLRAQGCALEPGMLVVYQ